MNEDHIHLPSVHIRAKDDPETGFDYEEDLYIERRGRRSVIRRVVLLVALDRGEPVLMRETRDELCTEEMAALQASLPLLMDEGNPEAAEQMQERARAEFSRQKRIANGEERGCLGCGCSETRACSGGCIWATETLCSKCVDSKPLIHAAGA